ncbi:MAG: bifunctional 23S rRNA (guanine(2069)-N(7))-methyltransferase RlmK/23S rRNA (guanine(2445)-N(2))-methyltransferase RlmL [Actinobacteria bacterium]|jgi:23S rRNA (guanine2445-N2)-methyltransferase / 23S rRNA (guanine2069-N7)-methyltransferase|nr:bifunctional 23S rRNA (guanine(2069)-N(7))-methyltransferase RlmK/23S rRNA (guanine(2445)-N(2))-methyltransferase RlmL [Actinomycetota bacterium]
MLAQPSTADHSFFVACPKNTEGLLLAELGALGAADARETRAGVAFTGTLSLAFRVCLWSRVASRVLMRLTSFPAVGPEGIYEGAAAVAWEDHLAASGTLAVEATTVVRQGPLANLNTHFAEQRVKDAVVDRFRARSGARPSVDLARPDVRINLHLTPEEALVGLDLSGDGLHKRGYRLEGGGAPLKENLAAAILLRAGWPRIAEEGGALVDPMCGSGTLLIEGALMAADIAPGLLRDYYGFLRWNGFDPAVWEGLLDEARRRRERGLRRLPPIIGYDVDRRALGSARANARRAGLAGRVIFEERALVHLTVPRAATRPAPAPGIGTSPGTVRPGAGPPVTPGLVVTNPPYGKRLGESPQLTTLYETLGSRLKEGFQGWEASVFTGNPELGAHLGLRAHRINSLRNGPLDCKLLLFRIGASPGGAASTSVPGEGRPPMIRGAGAVMFANRLAKNQRHLRRWAAREDIHCYRLYDADLPEYAVAVDLYEDWAHVQEYAAPNTVDPVRARRRLRDVMAVTPEALDIPPGHVVLKVRRRMRGDDQYQRLSDEGRFLEVKEDGLRFLVGLTDHLDTGLFLDHRLTRQIIRRLAPGRRFLNLFGYTGTATVYAAAGGAQATTTVDLSATYLDWARRNLSLNGFNDTRHSLLRADCRRWLAQAADRPNGEYDLIFLDAPTFSNSKGMTGTLDIQRDHGELIRAAVRLLSTQGVLLFSTNYRRFKLDETLTQELAVTDITKQTIPPDFARNPRIHRCYRIVR